ncbi:MAG: hypothetical protein L7F78_17235 [Syntrophales bacterium LBB04]|nr:hypothetical protein [Syntrophales bacterium LBB04]
MARQKQPLLHLVIGISCAFLFILSYVGCAFDLAHVRYKGTTLNTDGQGTKSFTLASDLPLSDMPCGYGRTLRSEVTWIMIGTIDHGEVYKSADQVLSVECSNVHEAYLVVTGKNLNGFYLPVEKGYVSLSKPIELKIKER